MKRIMKVGENRNLEALEVEGAKFVEPCACGCYCGYWCQDSCGGSGGIGYAVQDVVLFANTEGFGAGYNSASGS